MDMEARINSILEQIELGYRRAKAEWQRDRRNTFKDGRFLAYYEAADAAGSCEDLSGLRETLQRLFDRAKREWLGDKRNSFKDGRFLAFYELLSMVA